MASDIWTDTRCRATVEWMSLAKAQIRDMRCAPGIGACTRVSMTLAPIEQVNISLSISIYTRVLVCVRMSSDLAWIIQVKHVLLEMANGQVLW